MQIDTYRFSKNETLCVKAVAIMLMLVHHLFTFPEKLIDGVSYTSVYILSDGQPIEKLFGNFGKICVPIFMLLSGYGIYKNIMSKESDLSSKVISDVISKRIRGIYSKYWQVLIIFAPLGLILGAENISHNPIDWIINFFGLNTTFNNEAWFLTEYVIILCMLPFVIRFFKRKYTNFYADIILLIASNVLISTFIPSLLDIELFSNYNNTYFHSKLSVCLAMLPMFMMGCLMAKYNVIEHVRNSISKGFVAKIFGIVILVITFILRQNWVMRVKWGWDRNDFIYAALVTISVALLLDGLGSVNKVLSYIGKYSTYIWLVHTFFCYYYFQKYIYVVKFPILIFILLLGISLLVSIALEKLFGFLHEITNKTVKKMNN